MIVSYDDEQILRMMVYLFGGNAKDHLRAAIELYKDTRLLETEEPLDAEDIF